MLFRVQSSKPKSKTWSKWSPFGLWFGSRGPNRSPNGLHLDFVLDHNRSVWTTRGPNGPCVVQTKSKWTVCGPNWTGGGPKRSPSRVRLDFVLDHVFQTFSKCDQIPAANKWYALKNIDCIGIGFIELCGCNYAKHAKYRLYRY